MLSFPLCKAKKWFKLRAPDHRHMVGRSLAYLVKDVEVEDLTLTEYFMSINIDELSVPGNPVSVFSRLDPL